MIRNTASQKVQLFAYDYSTGAPKTGDAANLTAYLKKDSGALTALTDTSATEISATNAPGWYEFDVSQGETDAVDLLFTCKSSTANVVVVGFRTTTVPANFALTSIDSSGRLDVAKAAGTAWASGAIVAGALAAAACDKIADHGRRRTQANVEASSDGDAVSLGSLYGQIQADQESALSAGTLTVYKTDGTTSLGTKTVTSDPAAEPVTGIS